MIPSRVTGRGLASARTWPVSNGFWHGNVFPALHTIENLECQLDADAPGGNHFGQDRLVKAAREFATYIRANAAGCADIRGKSRHIRWYPGQLHRS